MNKILIKRLTIIFILLTLLLVPIFTKSEKTISDDWFNNSGSVIFSNDFNDYNLTDPNVSVDEYISMTDVYNYLMPIRWSEDDLTLKNKLSNLIGGKTISISNADELYYFANSQSINFNESRKENPDIYEETIKFMLDQNYILLDDIDYSVKRAQKFVPIGTNIDLSGTNEIESDDVHYFPFTGEFNGNGFEIKNLYLAEYSYITATFKDDEESSAVTVAIFKNYSMFSEIGEEGVLKNFILRDPILEVATMDATSGLFNTSILAGNNKGTIYNVGVIDEKKTQAGLDNSGIIFNVAYPSNEEYKAAGFVFDNSGYIYNSYLVTNRVISQQSESRFNYIYPFVFENSGDIEGINYNSNIILKNDSNKPNNINNLEVINKEDIKTNTNINFNTNGDLKWEFYNLDGYPQLKSLNYSSGVYEINNDRDLIFFSYLLNLNTPKNNKLFTEHIYVLTNSINMKNYVNYKTPKKDFKGELLGHDNYIYNMKINKPYIVGNNYYLGLFSNLSGKVLNVNFLNNELKIKSSNDDYGKVFYIGLVAGRATNATIKDVNLENSIDLGTEALGLTYAGSLVGYASGVFENIHVTKDNIINGNKHNFNNRIINGSFYVGGIIGSNNSNIVIKNSINKGNVVGVGSTNTNYSTSSNINSYVGGIIGEVNNINNNTSSLVYLTNEGLIDANEFIGKDSTTFVNKYVGGIFGSTKGYGYKLNEGSNVLNGRLENKGKVKAKFINTNTYIHTAGIGVMNTEESYAKISYLINKEGYDFTNFNFETSNTNMFYAQTVLDNSNGGVELSRAYNTKSFTLNDTYFNNNVTGANTPCEIEVGMFFVSLKNNPSRLLYVENRGSLTVGSTNNTSNVNRKLKISNITQGTRIDYKNVVNSGNINVLKINNISDSIYVAGVSWILAYDNKAYKMENILNEGNIITAGIESNTTINPGNSGQSTSATSFNSTLIERNLYVAGVVNINVGELDNSFNLGDITSTYNNNIKDISGSANTFVGGIATFNYHGITNTANSGRIEYTNSRSLNNANILVAGTDDPTSSSTFGGLIYQYNSGIVAGGIASAVGDTSARILENNGRNQIISNYIKDTINNGDIFTKAPEYVRAGGILGVALGVELASGTYSANSNTTIGQFGTSVAGAGDRVKDTELSNGLNYGDIIGITARISPYSSSNNTSMQQRPGIRSSVGGVIGYGLVVMTRMLNHGNIRATDVAGGIIGATYILGGTRDSIPITRVEINTAVHYGTVKPVNYNNYNNINYSNYENYYYSQQNEQNFLYPSAETNLSVEQNAKRGFGGIFGRLQRGAYGLMQSNNFKNIMNMDENIDMIGRADQSAFGSHLYFRFYTGNNGANETYYSSKKHDTSPAAVVGYTRYIRRVMDLRNKTLIMNVRKNGNTVYVVSISSKTPNDNWNTTTTANRYTSQYIDTNLDTTNYNNANNFVLYNHVTNNISSDFVYFGENSTVSATNQLQANNDYGGFGLNSNLFSSIPRNGSGTVEITMQNTNAYSNVRIYQSTNMSNATSGTPFQYQIMKITDKNEGAGLNIFDESFPLRRTENSEYIYPVEEDALANRFRASGSNAKPNGMYVLSSSTGSMDGAALPTNININKLFKLEEKDETHYVDLENVKNEELVNNSQAANHLLNKYREMFQLSYNDKSEILAEDESVSPLIADLKLYDPNGNAPTLTGGLINHTNKTVTFNVSNDAFINNNVYYEILSNDLSKNAIVSIDNINDNNAFRQAYNDREDNIIKEGNYKFSYTGSFSNDRVSFNMRVYAEIAAEMGLTNKYYTDYEIIINRVNTGTISGQLYLDGISRYDSGNNSNFNQNLTNTNNPINPNGKIEARFNDRNNRLPNKHNVTIEGLYIIKNNNEILIDSNYYDLMLNSKGSSNNNEFGFIITLSDLLESGTYRVKYGYYDNNLNRSITFEKGTSNNRNIVNVSYNGYSKDLLGNDLSFNPVSNNFKTYTKFGLEFNNVTNNEQNVEVLKLNKVEETNPNFKEYIDNADHYELYLNNEYLLSIKLAPFASLKEDSVTIKYEYDLEGKIIYTLKYEIKSEQGSYEEVVHTIEEREVSEPNIYLDNNLQSSNNVEITREAILSTIGIDYKFDELDYYNNVWFKVFKNNNEIINVLIDEIYEGEHSDFFNLLITNKLDKGNYKFEMYINREDNDYSLSEIIVTKLEGSSAYLLDVRFTETESDMVFEYPTIRVSDSNGNSNNSYDTRVFFDGIDYVGSDDGVINNFRIDARVSDILLEDFSPKFTLPAGASIERYDKENDIWTDELNADFVGYDDDLEVVKYRVISEDESQTVYYHVSITDLKYNLTLRFEIYYRFEDGTIIKASDQNSPIKNSVVLISSKNLKFTEGFTGVNQVITNVNGFPNVSLNDLNGINNQSSLYHFVGSDVNYRFGLNMSGGYNFNIITPKYSGQSNNNQTLGERYNYRMYMKPRGYEISDWNKEEYKLPDMKNIDDIYSGLFYYVYNPSTNPIIRELAIVVDYSTRDLKWGLNDDFASWD